MGTYRENRYFPQDSHINNAGRAKAPLEKMQGKPGLVHIVRDDERALRSDEREARECLRSCRHAAWLTARTEGPKGTIGHTQRAVGSSERASPSVEDGGRGTSAGGARRRAGYVRVGGRDVVGVVGSRRRAA